MPVLYGELAFLYAKNRLKIIFFEILLFCKIVLSQIPLLLPQYFKETGHLTVIINLINDVRFSVKGEGMDRFKDFIDDMPDNKFIYSGIFMFPVGVIAADLISGVPFSRLTAFGWLVCMLGGLAATAVVFLKNLYDRKQGKEVFTLRNEFQKNDLMSNERKEAMYPPVPPKYTSPVPEGYTWGTQKGKFVRTLPDKALNALIFGPPGSGKTTTLLLSILQNFSQNGEPPFQVIAMDGKGEIHLKGVKNGNQYVEILDPTRKSSVGWDPYWEFRKDDLKKDELDDGLSIIVRSLIKDGDPKDAFFVDNARDLLKGLLAYYFECYMEFGETIAKILNSSTNDLLKEVLADAGEGSIARECVGKFAGQEQQDSLHDIDNTMRQNLTLFGKESLQWAFDGNPEKASPLDLNDGKSLFISLPQKMIKTYGAYIRLIMSQLMDFLTSRPEDSKPILFILDELPTYGKITELLDALSTLRSRNVSIWCIVQSISQLESTYGKEDAKTIQNDSQIKVILNCDDMDSAKPIAEMCGKFIENHSTQNFSGEMFQKASGSSQSKEEKDIIRPADLMTLKNKNELVMILDGTYLRIKKVKYWEDKRFALIAKGVKDYNEEHPEKRESAAEIKIERKKAEDTPKDSRPTDRKRVIEDRNKTQDAPAAGEMKLGGLFKERAEGTGYDEGEFQKDFPESHPQKPWRERQEGERIDAEFNAGPARSIQSGQDERNTSITDWQIQNKRDHNMDMQSDVRTPDRSTETQLPGQEAAGRAEAEDLANRLREKRRAAFKSHYSSEQLMEKYGGRK